MVVWPETAPGAQNRVSLEYKHFVPEYGGYQSYGGHSFHSFIIGSNSTQTGTISNLVLRKRNAGRCGSCNTGVHNCAPRVNFSKLEEAHLSKIIADQVQKNGGDVLTPPSTDARNNQPMVGATNGNLTFSPLALPAADGAANRPVTTDGSAQLQFGAFAIPATAGTNGQFLTTNGTMSVG